MYASVIYYREQAENARRLVDASLQVNLKEELRRVAQQFEDLADDLAAEPEFRDTQVLRERN
jgi:hypothetical protein